MININREKFKLIIKLVLAVALVATLLPFADVTWVSDMNAYNTAKDFLGDDFPGLSWEFSPESQAELEKLMNAKLLNEDTYKKIFGMDIIKIETDEATGESKEVLVKYDPVVDHETFSGIESMLGVEIVGFRQKIIKKTPNYLLIFAMISVVCGIIILGNDDLEEKSLHLVSGGLSLLSAILLILAVVLFIPYYKFGEYGDKMHFFPHVGWYISTVSCFIAVALNVFAAFAQKKFPLTFKTK